jgi:hypothetical protein
MRGAALGLSPGVTMTFVSNRRARVAGILSTLLFGCVPLAGCGGDSSVTVAGDDSGGSDGATGNADSSTTSGDAATTASDSGMAGDDSATTTDSGTTASDSGMAGDDSATTSDSGMTASDSGMAGDDSATTSDSGMTASDSGVTADSGMTTDSGTGASDGGSADVGPSCPTGSACTNASGAASICAADGATCQCTDVTDDAACNAAYPGTKCFSGVCAAGCRTNTDCAAPTPTCGFSTPNQCGGCTSDAQCAAGSICKTTAATSSAGVQGQCIAASCTAAMVGAVSPDNPSDVCCGSAAPAYGDGTCCVGGSSCGAIGAACKATATGSAYGVCTTCTLPSPIGGVTTYYVDPNAGNDTTGVGSAGYGACSFKTVTRALSFIGSTPSMPVVIKVLGGSTLSASETLPIALPANVMVMGDTGGATLTLPANKSGFVLDAPLSGVSGFTIDGNAHAGLYGVVVSGSASAMVGSATTLTNVTIQNTAHEGILLNGAGGTMPGLWIGAGVTVTGAGTTAAPYSGLRATGSSALVISNVSGATTSFNGNSEHGILVDGQATVSITGTANLAMLGTGTVEANANQFAGLVIAQTPKLGATLTPCSVDGFTVYGTKGGNGIRIEGGSLVKVRNSVALGVTGDGIHVETNVVGTTRYNDVSGIDLGTAADPGNNLVQAAVTAETNGGVGICLAVDASAGATLNARGNIFETTNCATAASGTKLRVSTTQSCTGRNDVGSTHAATNKVDVTNCAYP